jgi:hypothetical protein
LSSPTSLEPINDGFLDDAEVNQTCSEADSENLRGHTLHRIGASDSQAD